jgi:tRNA threonylcarbamoyladenosine biosynthesis protein TsaE
VRLTQQQLEAWGEALGRNAAPPIFIALRGDLGAGKSTLARAIARGAGVRQEMPSPTFNLQFRYEAGPGVDVVHIDLYRIERADDLHVLGWRELGAGHEIVLVEWPERAESQLPPDRWEISLQAAGEDARNVRVTRHGAAPLLPGPA